MEKKLQTFLDYNTGKLFEFDLNNEVEHFSYKFNDNPAEDPEGTNPTWIYDYHYRIIKFGSGTGFAIVVTNWQQQGMILGCPDCALNETHCVFIVEDETVECSNRNIVSLIDEFNLKIGGDGVTNTIKPNYFYKALVNTNIPIKVYNHFYKELQDKGYIKLEVNSYA